MSDTVSPSHLEILRSVLACPTVPFHEDRVVDLVHQIAARLDHVRFRKDADGNVFLRYHRGRWRARAPLVLQAHLDHPGFVARSQTRTGRVTARFLGLADAKAFPGAGVVFHGTDPVSARVLSVRRPRDEKDLVAVLESDGHVQPGTPGVWDVPSCRPRGGFLETGAADDLVGTAAILCVFTDLARRGADGDVRAVFTRAEEVGFLGALAVLENRRLPRDARVVTVEVTRALPHVKPGGGPILRVGDARSVYSPRLLGALDRVGRDLTAKRRGFTYRRQLMDGGVCESLPFGLHGHEAACVCLVAYNLHNVTRRGRIGPERVHLGDLAGLIRYLAAITETDLSLDARDDATRARLTARYRRMAKELGST